MTIDISAPFKPYIGSGGVLTVSSGVPEQGIYWELVSWDSDTQTEGVPYGSLKYSKNKTDKAGFATNVYTCPTDPGAVGKMDRIKVKCGETSEVEFYSMSLSPSISRSKSPSISASISPSEAAPEANVAFCYHFDESIDDTGDYSITLNPFMEDYNDINIGPGNDFDDDSRIVEYWRFENNLTAGKSGNDLTYNVTVSYNTSDPMEGSYSLDLEAGFYSWVYRTHANLSAGFPLKSDDTTKKVSWALRIRVESLSVSRVIISQYDNAPGKRSLALIISNTGILQLLWGTADGNSATTWDVATGLVIGTVYVIGVAVDGINKTALVRVSDGFTSNTYTKSDWPNELPVFENPFCIGVYGSLIGGNGYDGLVDEMVVANDLLSENEFDLIRRGYFSSVASASPSLSPSLSPSDVPGPPAFAYVNGVSKANSAILLDGYVYFQTDPSENLYPYTGSRCFIFETVFQIDENFDGDYAWWPMPGMPPSPYSDLPSLILYLDDGAWWLYFDPINIYIDEETTIVPGNWYHVIAQYDGITSQSTVYGQVYVNGNLLAEDSWGYPLSFPEGDPDNRFDIACYEGYPDAPHFKGKLDLCRMLTNSQPWTAEEVAARYAAILAGA